MTPLLARLDAGDRALFVRWTLDPRHAHPATGWAWRLITHLGGASASVTLALATALSADAVIAAGGRLAVATLVLSHLLVQVVKRSVGRPRPRGLAFGALVAAPDRFSFPSGHSAAVASLAIGLGVAVPPVAPILGVVAMLVGISRVVLGVHYPGDVFVGQVLAVVSALAIRGL
jgi:undecaprenyl-diphosphatase